MSSASLQINQLLGDGASLKGKKAGKFNADDALMAGQAGFANFQALMASLSKSRVGAADTIGKILASSTIEATTGTKNSTGILAETTVTPELLAALKSLTPEQLETLKIDMPALGTDANLDTKTLGILDALSSLDMNDGTVPEFFTVVDDPELASALANLSAQLKVLQISGTHTGALKATEAVTTAVVQKTSLPSTINTPVMIDLTNIEQVLSGLQPTAQQTITIANLDGDGFQALKKLAFADLAPFLTQPRTVRIDNNSVMKVAQGPSFLNDEGTDATAMTLLAGLVPVMVKAPEAQVVTSGTGNTAKEVAAKNSNTAPVLSAPAQTAFVAAQTAAFANALAKATGTPVAATSANKPVESGAIGNTDTGIAETPTTFNVAAVAKSGTPAVSPQTPVTPLLVTVTPTNTATRGFTSVATGLDNGLGDAAGFDLSSAFGDALHVHADQTLAANSSTSLISARSASQLHPSTHLVSAVMQRAGAEFPAGAQGERQFIIQLDPPNMGRLKITLDFIENGKVRAKLIAERPETVSMLQKDAAVLERALQGSGFDVSAPDALTFDLGQEGTFSGGFSDGSNGQNGGKKDQNEDGTEFADIETVMAIFVDPETGLTHVNVVI